MQRYRKPWSKEKTDYLIAHYPNSSNEELAKKLGLTRKQVETKGCAMKLKKSKKHKSRVSSLANPRKIKSDYSELEIKDLLLETQSYQQVSIITGLSVTILRDRNHRRYHVSMRTWDKDKTALLQRLFSHCSDSYIAQKLDMTVRQIQTKARQLKLYKTNRYMQKLQQCLSQNIAGGPYRHQTLKGEPFPGGTFRGEKHPRYKQDRTSLKGGRRKQFRFSEYTKEKVRNNQQDKCQKCSAPLRQGGEFDHIKPIFVGGDDSISNCQLLCERCHFNKSRYEQHITNNFQEPKRILEQYRFIARNLV